MPTTRARVASAVFAYEAAALSTGRLPTITALCEEHRWLGAVTVTALVIHLRGLARRLPVAVEPDGAQHGGGAQQGNHYEEHVT